MARPFTKNENTICTEEIKGRPYFLIMPSENAFE